MAQLKSVIQYLDSLLPAANYQDRALNGLQVEAPVSDVRTAAFAVDAGLSVIEAALAKDADLLIVHHGLIWDRVQGVTGAFGAKIELLLRGRCALYASHLPLDGHREVGNAFVLGRKLGLESLEGFCEYRGSTIGAQGRLPRGRDLEYFLDSISGLEGAGKPLVLPFGTKKIERVGIVTGSGSTAIEAAAAAGLDLFISGEPKQEVYHTVKELRLNALFIGHYFSETFGIRALQQRVENALEIATVFIDEPTGI